MCTTENDNANEDAVWRLYGAPNDKVLRVEIDVDKLLETLNNYSGKSGVKVYISKMIYIFSRNDMMRIHTNENEFYHKQFFFEPFQDENYLSLMSLKQNAYEYENEVRFFCCGAQVDNDNLLKIPADIASIIKKVVVGPIYPFELEDPRSKHFDEYNDLDYRYIPTL